MKVTKLQLNKLGLLRDLLDNTDNIGLKYLRCIFGEMVDNARGCLDIMCDIHEAGDYHISDPFFHSLDHRYNLLKDRENRETRGELETRYEELHDRLENINLDVYFGSRSDKKYLALERDDDCGPSDEDLVSKDGEGNDYFGSGFELESSVIDEEELLKL
ncbi:hypothetical protein GOV12_00070 [Candidatus Pacearchaeota archaeon]|nr:hypothetical protein [Candidatus Pacearchaeota archaeon]